MTEVKIRKAVREDMSQVFAMIKALAVFEKMESQIKIDASVLERDGFDADDPAFFAFVAELDDGTVVGYALYYNCYSTWLGKSTFLEDLFVQHEYRKMGIGLKLFMAVAKLAHETSHRLDFHVLSWNPAVEFYEKLGAENLTKSEQWQMFRMNENSLSRLFE